MDKTPSSGIDPSQMFVSPESAARWAETRAERDERFHEATELMLDLANIQPGHRVLDVAAGTGDQTLATARRVGPTGYVLATDISSSMLELAGRARARRAWPTSRPACWTRGGWTCRRIRSMPRSRARA